MLPLPPLPTPPFWFCTEIIISVIQGNYLDRFTEIQKKGNDHLEVGVRLTVVGLEERRVYLILHLFWFWCDL